MAQHKLPVIPDELMEGKEPNFALENPDELALNVQDGTDEEWVCGSCGNVLMKGLDPSKDMFAPGMVGKCGRCGTFNELKI
jgi:hypothetical protein